MFGPPFFFVSYVLNEIVLVAGRVFLFNSHFTIVGGDIVARTTFPTTWAQNV